MVGIYSTCHINWSCDIFHLTKMQNSESFALTSGFLSPNIRLQNRVTSLGGMSSIVVPITGERNVAQLCELRLALDADVRSSKYKDQTSCSKHQWLVCKLQSTRGQETSKIKHFPDCHCQKAKSQFCIPGEKYEAVVDYFDMYAPVVTWVTIQLVLTISIIMHLSRQ